MNGDISVTSKYGEGSVFTVTLTQKIQDPKPIAQVEDPRSKAVLLYERRTVYQDSLVRSLEDLGVPVRLAGGDELPDRLKEGFEGSAYPFLFVSPDVAESIFWYIQKNRIKTTTVLLAKLEEVHLSGCNAMINIPAHTISIADVLNGTVKNQFQEKAAARFTAPEARVLIVDDIITNLKVAEGLLALYQMNISTCQSGQEAVDLVSGHDYDIVFMDHMMPEMDGVEATALIRNREKEQGARSTPIIALTANAVSGMREMFLGMGFNDYIAKPIEIAQLDAMIARWIPREKQLFQKGGKERRGASAMPDIAVKGLDVKKGLTMTGGTEEGYRKVLGSFCRDVRERLSSLESAPEKEGLSGFTVGVHALKSALATIGAEEISRRAAALEDAGVKGDMDTIRNDLPAFREDLAALAAAIRSALGEDGGSLEKTQLPSGDSDLAGLFTQLREALVKGDIAAVDGLIADLENRSLAGGLKDTLNAISDDVLMADYKAAMDRIDRLVT
jgi:CheY-like chemotaxis protein